ncbi:hypothetical protein [Microbacterium sp.]|uniref:hypothetical protein n=1 Tax=Microbacterium sp. TaxID=51671 RepID=UPI003A8AF234
MSSSDRQRVERVAGARRARLTAAPGTTAEPTGSDDETPDAPAESARASGANDERMRRDVPPHY